MISFYFLLLNRLFLYFFFKFYLIFPVSLLFLSLLRLNGCSSFFRVCFYCLSPFICRFYDLSPLVSFVNIFFFIHIFCAFIFLRFTKILFFFVLKYFTYMWRFPLFLFIYNVFSARISCFSLFNIPYFFLFLKSQMKKWIEARI